MAGSSFGTLFRVTTWGESHGKAVGAVIDGCPAGLSLCEEDIQKFLNRRKPGQNRFTTRRSEADQAEILSGVFKGKTTGTPISILIRNTDQHSKDYSEIAHYYRPGHADITFDEKYGFRDYRGGGRSSGRETIGRVCGGAVASKILEQLGIKVTAYTASIGPAAVDHKKIFGSTALPVHIDAASVTRLRSSILNSSLFMPDPAAETEARAYLEQCMASHDSSGGTVECLVTGMKPGIGEPVFDKLDADLGKALLSIGAVKAVEIGDGVKVSRKMGSENNDMYGMTDEMYNPGDLENSCPPYAVKKTNHAGGILGGMNDGSDILLRAHFKPTPSIGQPQQALFQDGSVRDVVIKGRHDPVIVPRAVVVVESMTAMTVLDLMLRGMTARLEGIQRFYST